MYRGFFSVAAVYAFGIAAMLAANILLARWLEVAEFGAYSFAIAIATFAAVPVSGGLVLLLTREIANAHRLGDWPYYYRAITTAIIWISVGSVLVCGLVGLAAEHANIEKAHLFVAAMAIVPGIGLMAAGEGVLKGLGRPALSEATRQLFVPPFLLIGAYILLSNEALEVQNLIWVNAAAYLLVGFAALAIAFSFSGGRYTFQLASKREIKSWTAAFCSFALIGGLATLSTQVAALLLGLLGSNEEVAYLRVAERGAQLVAMPLMFAHAVMAPRIATAHKDGNDAMLRDLSRSMARLTTFASLPVAIGLVVGGEFLIRHTFGDAYIEGAYRPLVALSFGQLLFVALGSPGLILGMCGHEWDNLAAQVAGSLLLVFLIAILAAPFGALGVSLGVAVGLVATKLIANAVMYRRLKFVGGVL